MGGGDTFRAEKEGDGCAVELGAVSTYGWYGLCG
jgi:hypothetical protein